MSDISNEFESFLKLCDDTKNHHGQVVRDTYYKGFLNWFQKYRNGDQSLDNNLKGMIKNGLDEEEAFMMLAYTGSYSSWVNSDLRNSRMSNCECKREFISRLNMALDKVIAFNNQTVFRMDSPSEDKDKVLNWFDSKVESIFRIPYFLSTAKEDYENTEIVWKIKTLAENSLGKDISDITNNQHELEVLFRTGSCFLIENVDFDKAYITLSEVSNDSQVDFELTGCYCDNI